MKPLSDKNRAFINSLIETGSVPDAVLAAGCRVKHILHAQQVGCRLLYRPAVREALLSQLQESAPAILQAAQALASRGAIAEAGLSAASARLLDATVRVLAHASTPVSSDALPASKQS